MAGKLKLTYCCLFFLLISTGIYAQDRSFRGGLILGVSGSQISGDNMAGFNKGGILGGIYIDFPFNKTWSAGFEMLFTMKGSKNVNSTDSLGNTTIGPGIWDELGIGYFEIPILVKYHISSRVEFYAGPGVGLLLYSSYYPLGFGGEAKATFLKSYEFSALGGVTYNFSPHFSATLRYSNSVASIGTGKANSILSPVNNGLLNIVASFGVYYHFVPNKL